MVTTTDYRKTWAKPAQEERTTPGTPSLHKIANHPNEDMAVWVMELRRRMRLTNEDFAETLGLSPYQVASYQTGATRPPQTIVDHVLTPAGEQYGLVNPPKGSDGEYVHNSGPRFAKGLQERYAELFNQ